MTFVPVWYPIHSPPKVDPATGEIGNKHRYNDTMTGEFWDDILDNDKDFVEKDYDEMERLKEKFHKLTSYNVSDVRYESPFEGKYDKDFIKIPMKYTGKMDVKEVSLDLFRSISKYTYASELNKQLVESLPLARALTRVVERADEHRTPKDQQNTRINAIRRIISAQFEGQKSNLDLQKLGSFEKPAAAIINLAKYLATWSTIKINVPASIANVVNAFFQNIINAGNHLYSKKTFFEAQGLYATRFFPAWQRDYAQNRLGQLTLESQMADTWEFVQTETMEGVIGEKSSKSKLYDFLGGNFLFNMREWGEVYVQASVGIAALQETKVNLGQDVISLIDAYELDEKGVIKLKDGIDKE